MRDLKFARSTSGLAPGHQVLALRGKLHHARVAIAIGYIKIAVLSEADIGGPVEGFLIRAGNAFRPEGEQKLAFFRELHHLVRSRVGDENVIVLIESEAVRVHENVFAPGPQVLSGGVEDNQRIRFLAALKNIDVAGGIDSDLGDASKLATVRHGV